MGVLCAILGLPLTGQNRTITNVPELPRQVVTSLLQDEEGYLWIGTRSGLFRYDGYEALHFVADHTDSTALINNTISSITQGPQGNIWVTTESGVSIYDPRTKRFRSYFHRHYVRQITFDETGRAWGVVGTLGLLHLATGLNAVPPEDAIAPIDVDVLGLGTSRTVSIAFDSVANEVILTGNSRATFDRKNLQLLALEPLHDATSPEALPGVSGTVLARSTDGKQHEWVATDAGLYYRNQTDTDNRFVPYRPDHEYFENNQITSLLTDRQGCLWVGSLRGVARIAGGPDRFRHHMVDDAGYQPEYSKILHLESALAQGRIWITTENSGLYAYHPPTDAYEHVELPATIDEREIYSVRDADTALWLSADNSIIEIGLGRERTQPASPREWARFGSYAIPLLEVRPGEWWIGTWSNGLHRVVTQDAGEGLPVFDSLTPHFGDDPVFTLLKDRQDRVWIGTRGAGVKRVRLTGGPVETFNKGNGSGLKVNGILHLYEDRSGSIWAATRGGGVARFDEHRQRFESFGLEDGLPDLTVCSIGETGDGELWLSTSNGLAHYLPDEMVPFWEYSNNDLFVNQDFSYQSVANDENGHLYFGSLVGFAEVVPKSGPRPPAEVQVRLTDFRVMGADGMTEDRDTGLDAATDFPSELSHRENSFTVTVTSLNLSAADRVRYAYRITGLEQEWNIGRPGEREIVYHKLPAGSYTLEVTNSDADGYWNEYPARFSFRVGAHPLLTSTALAIYGLLILTLLMGGWLVRANWVRLRRKLARNRATIRRQNRQMIYLSDISHEMRNRLTLILGPLERVMQGKEVDQVAVQRIYQNALRLKQLSDRVMKMRRTEDGGFQLRVKPHVLAPFLDGVYDRVHDLALIRGVELRKHFPAGRAEAFFDANVLEIILLNLLNNAIKYTPEGGSVKMQVGYPPDSTSELQITVRDTGIGIAKEELQQIFERFYRSETVDGSAIEGTGIGLELVARLVNLHHGTIHLQSEEGSFTEVKLLLPVGEEFYRSIGHLAAISPTDALVGDTGGVEAESRGTILVVEDNDGIRELIRDTLQPAFAILEAADGRQGLAIAVDRKPDLILSDLQMPEMDGLELLAHVRADPELTHVPFLILTGRYSEHLKLEALRAGVTDIIEKPFSGELLMWRMKSLFAERKRLEQATDDRPRVYTIEPTNPDELLSADEQFLQQLNQLMEEHHASGSLNVEFLATELAMSRPTLYRYMERLLQEAPANFIKRYRLKKAALLLQQRKFQVSEVAYMTGFSNPKYFSKCFQKEYGSTPTQYVTEMSLVNG